MATRVLIIDDEPQLRKLVRITLEAAGFEVRETDAGLPGVSETAFLKPDLVVLDLGLPDMDGQEVVRRIREWSDTPILVLSVRDDAHDKVGALEAGADDYVTKPFDGTELVARCHSLLRRRERRSESAVFESGLLHIDFATHEVRAAKVLLDLTQTEYALLRVLASNAGRVVTHAQILRQVWGPGAANQRQYLRVYIAALRRKLGAAAKIETVPGIGYRLASAK
ncbi:MAG: response regulator transcription factor [Chthoniobacterales bacterium]|nr:response regulator transcription factor [Chthoniobacterales bacterium]